MTRIAILKPDEMTHEQRAVIAASKASGKPYGGPFWAYIRNPKLMQSLHNMGAGHRRQHPVRPRTTDRRLDRGAVLECQVPVGRADAATVLKSDSRREEIDAINARAALPITDKRELLAQRIANELLARKD